MGMAGVFFFARRFYTLCSLKKNDLVKNSLYKSCFLKPVENIGMKYIIQGKYSKSYEGEGKTVAFIINKSTADVLCISSVRTDGFLMANGDELIGPIVLFPHSVLSWHVHSAKDINEESLVLFKVLEPKLDILVLGYGQKQDYTPDIRQKFTHICRTLGLKFEALPTEQACGIFNFLASERRYVAGALIPPTDIDVLKLERKKQLYIEDE